jgi:DNA-binding transcriptional LysR family regulator
VELRDIEIFLVLAEELHFGRTAERLHVSPARISQAVKAQERRIGAPLFDRTSRTVTLTSVGRQLRDDLQPVYVGLHASLERARMAARGVTARLRVGMMPFNFSRLWPGWKVFKQRNPQCELQIRLLTYDEPFARLRSGEFDVFVVWLPVLEPDLTVGPTLLTDRRLLAVAESHPLATRSAVGLETLADFPHGWADLKLDYWEESYLPLNTPRGRRIERAHLANNGADLISAVGMGDIVMAFPSHVTEYWGMPDIRYLPIEDMPPVSYALVWRTEMENDLIRALADTVRDLGPLIL